MKGKFKQIAQKRDWVAFLSTGFIVTLGLALSLFSVEDLLRPLRWFGPVASCVILSAVLLLGLFALLIYCHDQCLKDLSFSLVENRTKRAEK